MIFICRPWELYPANFQFDAEDRDRSTSFEHAPRGSAAPEFSSATRLRARVRSLLAPARTAARDRLCAAAILCRLPAQFPAEKSGSRAPPAAAMSTPLPVFRTSPLSLRSPFLPAW